jgi:hypothetical protein
MAFDLYGRYLIVPEGGGDPVAHTRATTWAATLDDRYSLEKWGQRMVAIGLSRRPDLLAQVAATPDEDKTRIDSIVVDAVEAGGSSTGRNIGDALHQFTQRVDLGEMDVSAVPEPWRKDVEAYRAAMDEARFVVETFMVLKLVEKTCVVPELTVAGTFDRIVLRDGRRFIFDLKTGQKLDHGWGSIATQLALYSRASCIYDIDTAERSPMPEVDQRVGIVAHLPAGQGTCDLIAVDLEPGWRGAQLAHLVRMWRKEDVRLGDVSDKVPSRRDWLVTQVRRLVDHYPEAAQNLAELWPVDVPTLKEDGHTEEQLFRIATVLQQVEGVHRIPFADEPDPALVKTNTKKRSKT